MSKYFKILILTILLFFTLELPISFVDYLAIRGYEDEILSNEKSAVFKLLKLEYLSLLQEKYIMSEENEYFHALTETVLQEDRYLLINTRKSKAYLKLKNAILREIDIVLTLFNEPISDKTLADNTYVIPKGIMKVQSKETNPKWYKPDWVYTKDGVKPPDSDSQKREISGVLGEYALYLGGGIVIHGQVSKDVPREALNFISIQMAPSDLKSIYKNLDDGSNVFIQ